MITMGSVAQMMVAMRSAMGGGSDLLPRLWTRFEYLTFYTVDPAGDAQEVTAVDRALV